MPTPDEIYQQVLRDEVANGSSPEVARARAAAARARAEQQDHVARGEGPSVRAGGSRPQSPRAAGTADNRANAVPERVQRLLAVVKPEALERVERQPLDRVSVWPHLLAAEAVALLIVLALLTVFSAAVDAPLREMANFNSTPNPSKAPWYFLGLQELLRYFHPQVAGVTLPTLVIITLMATPFIDRNPSTHPDDRKFAIVLFSFFLLSFSVLMTIGMFFRGPGFNFVFPWKSGIFFEL
jgi:menaquinol-cytochrome c reductase cytochrome b/c subunit